MKIKKNDQVLIISGKDRGRKGKVLTVFPKQGKVAVEGINIKKKHVKPKKSGEKGQIIEIAAPLNVSNLKIVCPKCGVGSRVGYNIKGNRKARFCKKCSQEIS